MFYFKHFLLLLNVALICYPAFVKLNVEVMGDNFETDLVRLETLSRVLKNATTNCENNAAAELDILMPPIELNESFAGFADITVAPLEENERRKESTHQAPNWWHAYHAFLLALGTTIMLLLMVLFTYCLWRRRLERRDLEWEGESASIFHSTPYYTDRGHILVY